MPGQATHSSRHQGSLSRALFFPPPPPKVSRYRDFFRQLAAGKVQPRSLNPLAAPFQPAAQQAPAGTIPAAPSAPAEATANPTASGEDAAAGENSQNALPSCRNWYHYAYLPCKCLAYMHWRERNPADFACRFVPYNPVMRVNDWVDVGFDILTEEQAFEAWRAAGWDWLPYNGVEGMTPEHGVYAGPKVVDVAPETWEENQRFRRYVNAVMGNRGVVWVHDHMGLWFSRRGVDPTGCFRWYPMGVELPLQRTGELMVESEAKLGGDEEEEE